MTTVLRVLRDRVDDGAQARGTAMKGEPYAPMKTMRFWHSTLGDGGVAAVVRPSTLLWFCCKFLDSCALCGCRLPGCLLTSTFFWSSCHMLPLLFLRTKCRAVDV